MDRIWIDDSRMSDVYENDVNCFLQFAQRNVEAVNGRYFCPFVNCLNGRRLEIKLIQEHVLCDGLLKSYIKWI